MPQTWFKVAELGDVPDDGTLRRQVGAVDVCLYRINGAIYATDDVCTHGQASLADGFVVNGDEIECPFHQGRFHIPTGKAVAPPCVEDIKTYAVRLDDDAVMLMSEDFEAPRD